MSTWVNCTLLGAPIWFKDTATAALARTETGIVARFADTLVQPDNVCRRTLGQTLEMVYATTRCQAWPRLLTLYARARSMRGDVRVEAGTMAVILRFDGEKIVIDLGGDDKPRARVHGSMSALLAMVAGKGIAWPVLSRAVRIGGNPLMLLRLLPLIRAPR